MRGGDAGHARRLAVGRQPAEGRDRPRAHRPTRSVIIAAQPTRGLDVGAIEFVHRRLVEERDAGRAVLLVSLELEEIRSLSDRVLVIYEGADRGRAAAESSEEDFGVAMTGGRPTVSVRGAERRRRRAARPTRPSRRGWPTYVRARRRHHAADHACSSPSWSAASWC